MVGTHIIEVFSKKNVKDPAGLGLLGDVEHLGVKGVKQVSSSQLYRLVGELSSKDRESIAVDLLTDPVTQEYRDGEAVSTKDKPARSKAVCIDVWYKSGVTDVIGESVLKGIRDLDIDSISEVRTGMRYRLEGLSSVPTAEKIAKALLANPLVHDQFTHVD